MSQAISASTHSNLSWKSFWMVSHSGRIASLAYKHTQGRHGICNIRIQQCYSLHTLHLRSSTPCSNKLIKDMECKCLPTVTVTVYSRTYCIHHVHTTHTQHKHTHTHTCTHTHRHTHVHTHTHAHAHTHTHAHAHTHTHTHAHKHTHTQTHAHTHTHTHHSLQNHCIFLWCS